MDMNDAICSMKQKIDMNNKPMVALLGVVVGATAAAVTTAVICNSKQARTMRLVKRAENILYRVGTAMRDVSGLG